MAPIAMVFLAVLVSGAVAWHLWPRFEADPLFGFLPDSCQTLQTLDIQQMIASPAFEPARKHSLVLPDLEGAGGFLARAGLKWADISRLRIGYPASGHQVAIYELAAPIPESAVAALDALSASCAGSIVTLEFTLAPAKISPAAADVLAAILAPGAVGSQE